MYVSWLTSYSVTGDNLCKSLLHILSPLQPEKRINIGTYCRRRQYMLKGDDICHRYRHELLPRGRRGDNICRHKVYHIYCRHLSLKKLGRYRHILSPARICAANNEMKCHRRQYMPPQSPWAGFLCAAK